MKQSTEVRVLIKDPYRSVSLTGPARADSVFHPVLRRASIRTSCQHGTPPVLTGRCQARVSAHPVVGLHAGTPSIVERAGHSLRPE